MEGILAFFGGVGLFILIVGALIIAASSIRIVRQSTVGVLERLGQYGGTREAGIIFLIPGVERLIIVDLKETVFQLPSQPVITKDNVTMNIDAVIYFQVTDAFRATYEVNNLFDAVEKLAMTTMRDIIGNMHLDQTLSSRDFVNVELQKKLDDATHKWGLKVNRVELKDIIPPRDIEEAMQKQMRAEREKRAQILLAEGEKQSAILKAEGDKEAAIRSAEGQKESAILRAEGAKEAAVRNAEGEAQAIRLVQQAEADMVFKVFTAINDANPSREVIQIKYLEALEKVSQGQSTTLFLPYESAAFLGALAGSVRAVQTKAQQDAADGGKN